MQINKVSPSFGAKVRTIQVLEAASSHMIESENVTDFKPFINDLWYTPVSYTGRKGFRYYIQKIGEKLKEKYPNIKFESEKIVNYANQNPNAKRQDFQEFVKPIIDKLGQNIDVTL